MQSRPGSVSSESPLLIPLHGSSERRPRQLDHVVATIGRARGCDLCLDASDVSTIHCLLYRSADGYRVRDCNSRTGVHVNGNNVAGSFLLHDGDVLNIGPFSFEVKLPREPRAGDAPPPTKEQALRWQESRRRLAQHALRMRQLVHSGAGDNTENESPRVREKVRMLDRRLAELEEAEAELRAEREALKTHDPEKSQLLIRERREIDRMKQELERSQAESQASLEMQRAALAQQEQTLRSQRAEVARMMEQLRGLQEELRRPHKADLQALSDENQRLRQALADLGTLGSGAANSRELNDARAEIGVLRELLEDRERTLTEAQNHLADASAETTEVEAVVAENEDLKKRLAEKDTLVEELRVQAAPKPPKTATELESYEAELNQYRQQLEADRGKLTAEIEQLRTRNQELDEATRELEMEMSRERAELARERTRVERMRDELKVDMEKMQRERGVQESLAGVQRLRDEMAGKRPVAPRP